MDKLADWRVSLNPEIKGKLASSFIKDEKAVLNVRDIYLTDVALAVYFQLHIPEECDESQLKDAAAGILRLLSGYAEQQRILVPAIGIISPLDEENEMMSKTIEKWAADQDWHRGDFSIFYSSNREAEEMIFTLLSGAVTLWQETDKITPLTPEAYLQWLKREYQGMQSIDQHRSLINAIIRSWEKGESVKNGIVRWTAESLSEISLLTEGGD